MKIKFLSAAAALTVAFASTAAFADDITITGSAAIVSSYKFRGIDQSNIRPAVQASVTVAHASGFYISTWGSSLASGNGTEIDIYGGYTKDLGFATVDAGLYGYVYPGNTAGNLFEVYGSLAKSYGPVSAKAGLYWAPKQGYFTTAGTPTQYSMYEYAELGYAIPSTPITLHSHIGHTGGGLNYAKQYLDYSVGASYKWKALTFDVSGVGTNVSTADAGSVAARRPAKSVVVLSLTAGF